jgi:hypothetical protein
MLTGEDTHRQAVQRLAFELLAAGNIKLTAVSAIYNPTSGRLPQG